MRRVRRLDNHKVSEGQDELFATYRYHAVFTDSPFQLDQAEPQHRGHAIIEQVFADLFTGPLAHLPSGQFHANAAWLQLAAMLLLVLGSVRLTVLLSFQSKDMFTSLQTAFEGAASGSEQIKQSGIHGFWLSLVHFSILAAIFIGRILIDIYLTQRFMISWRIWLTEHLTDDWLKGRAYYRDLFIDNTIDNPDQRIQQDVDIFTAGVGGTPIGCQASTTISDDGYP